MAGYQKELPLYYSFVYTFSQKSTTEEIAFEKQFSNVDEETMKLFSRISSSRRDMRAALDKLSPGSPDCCRYWKMPAACMRCLPAALMRSAAASGEEAAAMSAARWRWRRARLARTMMTSRWKEGEEILAEGRKGEVQAHEKRPRSVEGSSSSFTTTTTTAEETQEEVGVESPSPRASTAQPALTSLRGPRSGW